MKKIGIVVAMAEELEPYLSALGKVVWQKNELFAMYGIDANGKEIIVIKSGVGEIAAAAATQRLIDLYQPDLIVNYGFAGALVAGFNIGDIVLIQGVVHYEYDISPLDTDLAPYVYREIGTRVIPVNFELIANIDNELKCGLCASGNLLVTRQKMRNKLSALDCCVCEMESAGILLTAKRAGIPCAILKVISDNADENAMVDFDKMVAETSVKFEQILRELIKTI